MGSKRTKRTKIMVLEDLEHNQIKSISREVVGFKESHFYGDRLPRKNVILNSSRTRNGAALKFKRKNC
ncbi:8925_t:CDS:2 [Diversispora eburnea]|uniref:8925_t:CDS:1 n=1 Tax=Diversispora eburnea TaxID=1213867 RepID=A0A9N9G353_9GLOM|nr:8925_t:CDS:2 [Diversispora eburnea]